MYANQILNTGNNIIDIHLLLEYLFDETQNWNLNISKKGFLSLKSIFFESIGLNFSISKVILMDLGDNPKEERLIPEKIKENVQFNHIPFIIIGSELPLRSLAADYEQYA